MAKKFSDVFGSIRYSKIDPKHNKSHVGGSTDDEEHGAVSSIEFDQQVKHAKKRSMTESESVKRTQTNLKNIEASKTGYSVDDEQYRKHIERMKKSRDEYIKNNPNSIYKRTEEVENIEEKSELAKQNKTTKNTMDASRGASWKIKNSMTGDSVRDWDNKHPNAQAQNKAIGRALRSEAEQIEEAIDHIITARQIIGQSKRNAGSSHEYMKFLKSLRDKFGKEYSTNVHKTAAKLATESVELDEGWGAEPARREAESHAKAYDAVKEKHKRDPVASAILNHIQGMKAEYAEKEATGKGKQSREFWLKDIEKKKARMGNFKNVGVSLNKESTDKKSMFEAIGANASNKTHEGSFQEKDYSKHFTYKKTNDTYAKKHNLPHEIDVGDGVRYGHVKGTVAHIATDENDDGTPKMQKWQIKNHKKWMKESRQADIVREAYMKAKNKKKDEKNDKNVSGKVEKYEADPVLTDTMQKQ
jgi:hypothetical protein